MRRGFVNNVVYSFTAQAIQLCLSVLITLFLPKLLSLEAFAYWQLFIFYTQFSGFFHFGIVDGIYLREGGRDYASLDYGALGFQLKTIVLLDVFIAVIVSIAAFSFCDDSNRLLVILASGIFMVIMNANSFFSLTYQSVNLIKQMSIGRMLFSGLFLTFLILSIVSFKSSQYLVYIIVYIACYSICLLYYLLKGKEIAVSLFGKANPNYKRVLFENFKSGAVLTMANISGMLILGIARYMIDIKWGLEMFSMISYAMVLVNFVLLFINELSFVLYPELRSMSINSTDGLFVDIQKGLALISPVFLILFFPMALFIEFWLPDYAKTIEYMTILLPLCVYEAKVSLLTNTYFKVLNRPKDLLLCNIKTLILGFVVLFVSIFVVKSIKMAVFSMLFISVARYLISLYQLKPQGIIQDLKNFIPEACIVGSFVILNNTISFYFSLISYLLICMIYLVVNRSSFGVISRIIRK